MSFNWGPIVTGIIGAAASAYEANQARQSQENANKANEDLWSKGYWSVRSPYMEAQIQPALQAILAKAADIYGHGLGLNFSPFTSPVSPGQMYGGMNGGGGMSPGLGGAPGQGGFPASAAAAVHGFRDRSVYTGASPGGG